MDKFFENLQYLQTIFPLIFWCCLIAQPRHCAAVLELYLIKLPQAPVPRLKKAAPELSIRSTAATGPEVSFSLNQKTGSALTRTGIFNVSFDVSFDVNVGVRVPGSYRDTSCVVKGMASVLQPLRDERGWQR